MRQKGGNAYPLRFSQLILKLSVAMASKSGFQLTYFGSCVFVLVAKRSISIAFTFLNICLNMSLFSIQSLESCLRLDNESAVWFRSPGRYSAVIVSSFSRQYSQICFVIPNSKTDDGLDFLLICDTAVTLSICMITCAFLIDFVNALIAMKPAFNSFAFMCQSSSSGVHTPCI